MAVFVEGTRFLFVGNFESMTKDQARALVKSRGGLCPSAVSANLDYLVVGNEDSPDYGGFKRPKQLKAEALVEAGAPIAVISENEFLAMMEMEFIPPEQLEDVGMRVSFERT